MDMVLPASIFALLPPRLLAKNPMDSGLFRLAFTARVDQFGKYKLLRRLGAGGMGEVFLARSADLGLVVVKRILPHLTENERFLRLFLDETRIAARLLHPNIARVHELGEVGETWYVAMEHVAGKDLRQLLKRGRDQETATPLPVALFIAREIAAALAYAHALKDSAGKIAEGRSPRRLTPQHPRVERGSREAHRLRSRARREQVDAHRERNAEGEVFVHGARAGVRETGRRAHRRLRARHRALGNARREAALPFEDRRRDV